MDYSDYLDGTKPVIKEILEELIELAPDTVGSKYLYPAVNTNTLGVQGVAPLM